MKMIIYSLLFIIVAPLYWAITMIDLGISKVYGHILMKLMECMLRDNEQEE